VRLIATALLCLLGPAAFAFEGDARLVETFVSSIVKDSVVVVRPIASTPVSSEHWFDLNDTLDAYDCFTISRYSWRVAEETADSATIELQLYATAITTGVRVDVIVPTHWLLRAERKEGEWRLRVAETLERALIAEYLKDRTDEHWRRIASTPGIDLDRLLIQIATRGIEPTDVGPELAAFTLSEARASAGGLRPIAEAIALVGHARANSDDKPGAEAAFREMIELGRAAGDADIMSHGHFRLGVFFWIHGNDAAAIAEFQKGGALVDRTRDPRQAMRSLYLLALVNEQSGKLPAGLAAAEEALRQGKRFGWLAMMCTAPFPLASAHSQLGNMEVAMSYQREALRCAEERQHNGSIAMALGSLTASLHVLDPEADIEPLIRRAIAVGQGWIGNEAIALMHTQLGFLMLPSPEAEKEFETALRLAEPSQEMRVVARALIGLASLRMSQKRFEDALIFADRAAVAATRPSGGARVVSGELSPWPGLLARGRALRALDRPAEAEVAFREAVRIIESLLEEVPSHGETVSNFLQDKTSAYRELADLLAGQKRYREAVTIADGLKARALRDLIAAERGNFIAQMTRQERAEEERLVGELQRLNAALLAASGEERGEMERLRDEARIALDRFESNVSIRRPNLRPRTVALDGDPLRSEAVAALPLILDYLVTEDHTTLFAIRGGEIETHRIAVEQKELAKAVDQLMARIKSRDLRYGGDARRLYDLLLAPVEKYFAAAGTIHIVADDALWNLPFHALRNAGGKYLIETAAVHYAPSLGALGASRTAVGEAPTVLALGDPAIGQPSTSVAAAKYRNIVRGPLPDAAKEVAAIAKIHGARATVLTGTKALERTVKSESPKFDVIHFATHAFADDRQPLYSGILLAATPGDGEDGILEARELLQMNLNADLVVLAACASGAGKIRAGEGTVGLSWAFLVAGCPRTVVTKWEVDSASTRVLMTDFHRRLREGDRPATALRHAQLKLMRDPRYAHPLEWAPFIVLGAP